MLYVREILQDSSQLLGYTWPHGHQTAIVVCICRVLRESVVDKASDGTVAKHRRLIIERWAGFWQAIRR